MKLLHEIGIFQIVKSKVIILLFETVRLSVSISLRNLYNSLNNIKENLFLYEDYKGKSPCFFMNFTKRNNMNIYLSAWYIRGGQISNSTP